MPRYNVSDIDVKNEYVMCHIPLSQYVPKFHEAQVAMDQTIMQYMIPVIPYRTGAFLGRILEANGGRYGEGRVVAAVPPQGHYLYNGVSMWTGRPLHYTNPKTVPFWGKVILREHKHDIVRAARRVIFGGK